MQKQADGSWSLTASMDDGDGNILDNRVDNIRFADDGSFVEAGGVGTADTLLSFQFNNITMPQTVNLNFGTPGSYDGRDATCGGLFGGRRAGWLRVGNARGTFG